MVSMEETIERTILRRTKDSKSKTNPSSSISPRKEARATVIDVRDYIFSVAFLADGKHIVSADEKRVRRWRMEDGEEVGTPMEVGGHVWAVTASPDGKWIVSGSIDGWLVVWNAETHKKVTEFRDGNSDVRAVDVSPDGTRIASGTTNRTLNVWSLSHGKRLLGPLKHDMPVVAARFSPDGCFIATADKYDLDAHSVHVYDSQHGHLLVDVPIQFRSYYNNALAWATSSKQLFVLSSDANIHRLDVSTGTTLSKWPIHSSFDPACIAVTSDGMFIAASAGSSVSLWTTGTQEQVGAVIEHAHDIRSMAISANHDLVVGGDKMVSVCNFSDMLPPSLRNDVSAFTM